MNLSRKTRFWVRLLIVVPLLSVVSPWHAMHHSLAQHDTGVVHVDKLASDPASVDHHAVDAADPTDDGPVFLDRAPHCDSGACAASIDTVMESVVPRTGTRYLTLHHPAAGAAIAPLSQPPRLRSPVA